MRFKTSGKNKIIKEQMKEENTEMMVNCNKDKENKKKQAQTTVVQKIATPEEKNEMKNFHNDCCKTCVRMRDIMGSIMPHPINV